MLHSCPPWGKASGLLYLFASHSLAGGYYGGGRGCHFPDEADPSAEGSSSVKMGICKHLEVHISNGFENGCAGSGHQDNLAHEPVDGKSQVH